MRQFIPILALAAVAHANMTLWGLSSVALGPGLGESFSFTDYATTTNGQTNVCKGQITNFGEVVDYCGKGFATNGGKYVWMDDGPCHGDGKTAKGAEYAKLYEAVGDHGSQKGKQVGTCTWQYNREEKSCNSGVEATLAYVLVDCTTDFV